MKYYIADTHFGHQNILSFAKRPFSTIDEMEKTIISNWNHTVNENDEVYIVGDLFYRDNIPGRILSQLKGRKILILGNHEAHWLTKELEIYFDRIETSLEIIDHNHTVYLCHYPMVSYPKQSRAYMIHGHIHNDTLFDYWCILLKRSRILNAGVDINHFKPVTLDELITNNTMYKQTMINSYPMHLLSIRRYEDDEKTQQWINEKIEALSGTELREGIIQINQDKLQQIELFQKEILENDHYSSHIKNFDVVTIDKAGQYSYLSILHPDTIYIK